MIDDEGLPFIEAFSVRCPCGGRVQIGTLGDHPAAIHSLPFCRDYESRDLADFMRWLRQNVAPVGRRAPHLFSKESP